MKSIRMALLAMPVLVGGVVAASMYDGAEPALQVDSDEASPSAAPASSPQSAGWDSVTQQDALKRLGKVVEGINKTAIPGLAPETARRFWQASGVVTRFAAYPQVELIGYEFGTRCAFRLSVDISKSRPTPRAEGFAVVPQIQRREGVPSLAVDSAITLTAFMHGAAMAPAEDCTTRVEAAYGASFAASERQLGALIDHAAVVLAGGEAGSADAPLSDAAARQTTISRIRAGGVMKDPIVLATLQNGDQATLLFGEPHAAVRWAAQYSRVGDGKWRFEGASDAGLTLIPAGEKPDA